LPSEWLVLVVEPLLPPVLNRILHLKVKNSRLGPSSR
jgi:hypothetical protein